MTISELLQYYMAKPGAKQSVYNDQGVTQIKVGDTLSMMVREAENRLTISPRTSPKLAELLRRQYSDAHPGRYLSKTRWNTVYLDGSLPEEEHRLPVQL